MKTGKSHATKAGKRATRTDVRPKPAAPKPVDPAATPKAKARKEPDGAKRRATGEKRARLNESLILELRALRAALTQATEAFDLRVGGLIAEMLQSLEGDASLDQRPRQLTVALARAALDEMARQPATGNAGRLRELRRIQRLTKRLQKVVAVG